ncbi:hypothetical protein ONZ45_g5902 [Pleurotus djamor]|nr:hypothetical protein ONZ45_g5902 [Pleurotus djamor]
MSVKNMVTFLLFNSQRKEVYHIREVQVADYSLESFEMQLSNVTLPGAPGPIFKLLVLRLSEEDAPSQNSSLEKLNALDWDAMIRRSSTLLSSQFLSVLVKDEKVRILVLCTFSNRRRHRLPNSPASNAALIRQRLDSPSTTTKNAALIPAQNSENVAAVYDGRPGALTGPSIGIYHPIFKRFQRKVAKQPSLSDFAAKPSAKERLRAASRLLHTSAQYFSVESKRHEDLEPDLKLLLSSGNFTGRETTFQFGDLVFKPDGNRYASCPLVMAMLSLVLVLKNGIGLGEADPIEQAVRGYQIMSTSERLRELRKISCMPAFLLGICGPNLTISGVIYLEGVVTQRLIDYISLVPYDSANDDEDDYSSDREALVHRVAHVFSVLDECLVELDEYYEKIESAIRHPLFPAPHFNTFTDDTDEICTLSYTNRRFPPRSNRAVFHATLTSPTYPGRDCIVKFTKRYNAEAHRLMHQVGVAPKLIYCKYEPDVGKICVVSEYIHDDFTKLPTDEAMEKLRVGLKALHDKDYVFGDLRDANVVVNDDRDVFLVDFDWCGKVGKAFYPHDLNTDGVTWATGVKGGDEITKAHDVEMLGNYIASVHRDRQLKLKRKQVYPTQQIEVTDYSLKSFQARLKNEILLGAPGPISQSVVLILGEKDAPSQQASSEELSNRDWDSVARRSSSWLLTESLSDLSKDWDPQKVYVLVLCTFSNNTSSTALNYSSSSTAALTATWLEGQSDLITVWEHATNGELFEEIVPHDADIGGFPILHRGLGLADEHGTPIVIMDEYEEMWTALMGQPGTGKSMFIRYAMARACHEKRPFILSSSYDKAPSFYFDGRTRPRVITFVPQLSEDIDPQCFALVHSLIAAQAPLHLLYVDRCIAVTTSPESSRWDWAKKETYQAFFHVKVPSIKDLKRIAYVAPAHSSIELHFTRAAETLALKFNELEHAMNGHPIADNEYRAAFHAFFFMEPPEVLHPYFADEPIPTRVQRNFMPRYKVFTLWQWRVLQRAISAAMRNTRMGDRMLQAIPSVDATDLLL